MPRSLRTLALFGALAAPAVLLAVIGARSLAAESARAAARYGEQAQAVRDTVVARLERELAGLATAASADAIEARFALDGTWLGEPEQGEGEGPAPAHDPILLASLRQDVDRLQARGELGAAIERVRAAADKEDDAPLAAWALGALAALCELTGEAERAAAARQELIERFPDERDARGLKVSFAARFELARGDARADEDLLALYSDAIDDYRSLDETARASFVAAVRAELARRSSIASDPALAQRLDDLDRRDLESARRRAWRAALSTGITDWIAQGAPSSTREFTLSAEPVPSANPLRAAAAIPSSARAAERIVLAVRREGEEWAGSALETARLYADIASELERDPAFAALGFLPLLRDETGAVVGAHDPRAVMSAGEPMAEGRPPPPLERYVLEVRGGDLAGFLARERRQVYGFAALVALALGAAAIGAFATLRAVAREVAAAESREAFVAAVTHELKAPLAAIRLFGEVLARGDVEPEKVAEFGARTLAESDRLARLVDTVLDLAKIEHGGGAPREPLDLVELAERGREAALPLARERGFALQLAVPKVAVRVRGDRDALSGALFNLLDNALKYSAAPGAIEIAVERTAQGRCELAVLDRGPGVPAAERERIFEPFARLGDELTRERPGVGLGLALVRRIAEAHGGRARCDAREGGGSRFVLELPAIE